jgi:hypothetical protein
MRDKENQESSESFDLEKYEFLKPLLKTILREANQNPRHAQQSIKLFISALNKRFGYDFDTISKMKPYVKRLLEDLKSEKESLN